MLYNLELALTFDSPYQLLQIERVAWWLLLDPTTLHITDTWMLGRMAEASLKATATLCHLPVLHGNQEMVRYLSSRYERVHAVIGVNPQKKYVVSPYERQELFREMLKELGLSNVEVVIVCSSCNFSNSSLSLLQECFRSLESG